MPQWRQSVVYMINDGDQAPRVAFFTDSFHEVNGVALTSRQFEQYARTHGVPMFSCHAGPATKAWTDGSITRSEWKRSRCAIGLESDLSFDLLFLLHHKRIRKQLEAFAPDVVHITSPGDCGFLGMLLAREIGIPLVASWHTNVHEFGATRLAGLLRPVPARLRDPLAGFVRERILDLTVLFYRQAEYLFAPNQQLVELLKARTGKPCREMSRGIDTDLYTPARRQRSDDIFRIGFVGRLSPEKSVEAFAELENDLLARGLTNFEILLTGDGSLRSWLETNLRCARMTGVLLGEALADFYASLDVFAFPSRTDTFGNVILEAQASGVPCVVTNEGGPQFLIEDGVTGVTARDNQHFCAAIATLMREPDARKNMAAAARRLALQRYTWREAFKPVYEAYQTVVANHRAHRPQDTEILARGPM